MRRDSSFRNGKTNMILWYGKTCPETTCDTICKNLIIVPGPFYLTLPCVCGYILYCYLKCFLKGKKNQDCWNSSNRKFIDQGKINGKTNMILWHGKTYPETTCDTICKNLIIMHDIRHLLHDTHVVFIRKWRALLLFYYWERFGFTKLV
jgi:hypothetical protein